jgi:hypothetical protein
VSEDLSTDDLFVGKEEIVSAMIIAGENQLPAM